MKFVHTNIVAKDWKKLSEFYINVFNCIVKPPERKLSGDWLNQGTGLKNAELEGVHLLLPGHGDQGPTLEIFSYKDMIGHAPLMANHTGLTHIAFEVEDTEDVFDKALAHGATKLGQITKKELEGIGIINFVYLRDPEGNIVEIQSWKKDT